MNKILVSKENAKFEIKVWHLFWFNFTFLLLCYLPNLQMRFSVDTYRRVLDPKSDLFFSLKDGRLLTYLISKIQHILRLYCSLNQQVYFFVFVAIISLCTCILMKLFIRFSSARRLISIILIDFAFLFGFTNVLMQEYFCFPEMYLQYGTGLLLMSFSIYNFFTGKNIFSKIIFSYILLVMSLSTYQIFIQPWLILISAFVLFKHANKFCKDFWIDMLWISLIFILSILTTVFLIKMMQLTGIASTERGFTFSNIVSNSNQIFQAMKKYFCAPLTSIVGIVIYIIIGILVVEYASLIGKLSLTISEFLVPVLIVIFGFCVTFGMHIVMSDIWLVPRVLIGLGFIIPALLICFVNDNEECLKKIFVFGTCSFFISIYYVQSISINQYANNRLDQEYAHNIICRICEYEKNNKCQIKNVSFCTDKNPTWGYYGNINFIFGDVNIRELMVDWGQIELINYYSHRNFKKVDMPKDVYEKYFANKNWDYYKPEDQLVFIGDTLYICVY